MWPLNCGAYCSALWERCLCTPSIVWGSSLPRPTACPKCESVHNCPSRCRLLRTRVQGLCSQHPALKLTLTTFTLQGASAQSNGHGVAVCVASVAFTAALGRESLWTRLARGPLRQRDTSPITAGHRPDPAQSLSVHASPSEARCGTDSSFPVSKELPRSISPKRPRNDLERDLRQLPEAQLPTFPRSAKVGQHAGRREGNTRILGPSVGELHKIRLGKPVEKKNSPSLHPRRAAVAPSSSATASPNRNTERPDTPRGYVFS